MIAFYDQALKIKPDDYEIWNLRGNALQDLERNEEAIASYDQALKIKPDDYEVWNHRGNALQDLGRNEELTFPVKSGNIDIVRVSDHKLIFNKRRLMRIKQRETRTFRIALMIAIAVIER